ncbi:MAG TPA: Rnase Y domain-containing protein, partial [Candidatus Limnocylindria bacterium]|nr:Rnase Y domain-containing protein [Candidatus Limnocylindria bacterium]
MMLANSYLAGGIGFTVGALLVFIFLRWKEQTLRKFRALESQSLIDAARREADSALREARLRANEEALKLRQETEQSFASRLQQITETEGRLTERERLISRQLENLVTQENALRSQTEELQKQTAAIEAQKQEQASLTKQRVEALAAAGKLSEVDARAQLLKEIEQQAQADAGALARRIVEDAKTHAEEKARWIISTAVQRYAGSHAFESTSSTLTLPDNEIKGRIIGREGRNIRAFEGATGVTVLIDDTPNAVVLSGFDPVRREIAREAMQRLIIDGRIHPTRIEEVVGAVKSEMEEAVLRSGEEAVVRAGIAPVHTDIMKLLGRLKFRQSYSQNVLEHSIEVAHLMSLMAGELGLDIETAK